MLRSTARNSSRPVSKCGAGLAGCPRPCAASVGDAGLLVGKPEDEPSSMYQDLGCLACPCPLIAHRFFLARACAPRGPARCAQTNAHAPVARQTFFALVHTLAALKKHEEAQPVQRIKEGAARLISIPCKPPLRRGCSKHSAHLVASPRLQAYGRQLLCWVSSKPGLHRLHWPCATRRLLSALHHKKEKQPRLKSCATLYFRLKCHAQTEEGLKVDQNRPAVFFLGGRGERVRARVWRVLLKGSS